MNKCTDCGQQAIPFPEGKPCPLCAAAEATPRFARAGRNAQAFDPVLIFKDASGNIRFPGRNDAQPPEGFHAVELRTAREVRTLEAEVNRRERDRHAEAQARESAAFNEVQARNRSELRTLMKHMTPAGRRFAEMAMEDSDRRAQQPRANFDAGFHVEVFSQDSSNRDPYRDDRTGWKPKKN